MRRSFVYGLLLALSLLAVGCGGSRERGKNSDFDRPAPKKDAQK